MKLGRVLVAAALALPSAALAWESICFDHANPEASVSQLSTATANVCEPFAGPHTARQRWIGPLDEHRQLWEETRVRAGLPASLGQTILLPVFTSAAQLTVGTQTLTSLQPAAFTDVQRVQTRAFSIGELAQLPDFSYALWDWALGHETCPLSGVGVDAEKCHDFASHMGPVNSNHFLPQAASFYARYHGLAMTRAASCKAMKIAMDADAARFDAYLKDCEVEALALEAVGQHYLHDAWSSGHMWERWGSPDLSGFAGADATDQRERAVLVALVSGLIHGSRGVLQRLPEWTSYDVNDAMCAPNDAVQFVTPDGTVAPGVGDDYLGLLASNGEQSRRFFSCAVSGLLDVYEASGQLHGPIGTQSAGWSRVDPLGAGCFGQRVTNAAMLTGMGLQMKVAGIQMQFALNGETVSWLVPKVAQGTGGAAVETRLKNRFRLELMRMVSVARIVTKDSPRGTELATGRLGDFLGAKPNGAYVQPSMPLASYIDPDLPWPDTADATDPEAVRARALGRLFHRAHLEDWCRVTTTGDLEAMRAHAVAPALDATTRYAACGACSEFVVRHLRVGDASAWDTSREPACHYVTPAPAYVHQPGAAGDDVRTLARAWCGC